MRALGLAQVLRLARTGGGRRRLWDALRGSTDRRGNGGRKLVTGVGLGISLVTISQLTYSFLVCYDGRPCSEAAAVSRRYAPEAGGLTPYAEREFMSQADGAEGATEAPNPKEIAVRLAGITAALAFVASGCRDNSGPSSGMR
jgi:hypothetical protein